MSHRKYHHPQKPIVTETITLMNDRSKGEIYLVKTLGLDSVQQKKLDKIMETHFTIHDKFLIAYNRNQKNLFNALKDGRDTTFASRCADSLGILKVAMTKEFFSHFSNIKEICSSAQQKQFDELIDNMSAEFLKHHNLSTTRATQDSL